MRIDSHHHFWIYDAQQYSWISESMAILQRNFLPADLQLELKNAGIDGAISVQARQTVDETRWLIQMAEQHEFIRGVVGWVPLADDGVEDALAEFANCPWLRGVRHVVQDEPDDRFILDEAFNRGVAILKEHRLVFDILIFARQLRPSIQFVDQHPDQSFVLDHIAKPAIHSDALDREWHRNIQDMARRQNVVCKFSGVVTEVTGKPWNIESVRPYWDVVLEAFGPGRLMFGSDWPVCLLKSEYHTWSNAVETLASELSNDEQSALWADTAIKTYGL